MDGITDLMAVSLSKLQEMKTGKPGMLQSMGSQRVGRDWVSEQEYLKEIFNFTQFSKI